MKTDEWNTKLHSFVDNFFDHWKDEHRKNPEMYPDELEEEDWWENFVAWVEMQP